VAASPIVISESASQGQIIQTDNSLASASSITDVGTQTTAFLDTATSATSATSSSIDAGLGAAVSSDTDTSVATSAASSSDNVSNSTQKTVAIAGGVIGGVVAISLIVFLFLFWRKRMQKHRRSTLLTPLGPESGFGFGNEKSAPPYNMISRMSFEPHTLSDKFKGNFRRIQGRFGNLVGRHSPTPSVNLNRGNSQFIDNLTPTSMRSAGYGGAGAEKRGFFGAFGRLNEKLRGNKPREHMDTRGSKSNNVNLGSQPDFLTLLNMDEKQLAAQAGGGRRISTSSRRSQSAGSADHFLGGLGLDFNSADPFSDRNAMTHDSAKIAPLAVTNQNPFSDSNSIQQPAPSRQSGGPTNYVHNIRQSRGQSISGITTRPPSTVSPSVYRESGSSVESFQTRRNKFRSDPFDLDRPELLSSSVGSDYLSGATAPPMPNAAHTRNDSFTSKYSSGVSIGDWSDPGPDVGPATTGWDSARSAGRRKSGASQGSQGTVGKAY
jgi:hypothetical protein